MKAETLIWYLINAVLILAGVLLFQTNLLERHVGSELNVGLASGLITTGVCGVITYIATLQNEARYRVLAKIQSAGIVDVFRSRSVTIRHEYSSRIEKSKKIDIIGFGLSAFREDYKSTFSALAGSKSIRILLANPTFPIAKYNYCDQRDLEEGNALGQIAKDVELFIRETESVRRNFPDNFRVRKMKVLPSINVFRMDGEILWGPYLVRDQSRNMPTFLVRHDGHLFSSITQHFDAIWDSDELSEQI